MKCFLSILIIAGVFFRIGEGQRCPTGWLTQYQRCFLIIDDEEARNYHDAANRCRQLDQGATLAVIESPELNDYIASHMVQGTDGHWIGLDDLSVEGMFEWADGKHLDDDQASWDEGEPAGGQQDCVQLRRSTKKWTAKTCSLVLQGLVCQTAMKIPTACDEDNGWNSVNDRCMKYFSDKKTWDDAQSYCRTLGNARLVKITGLIVQDYVTGRSGDSNMWTGLSDLDGQTGEYAWMDKTTPKYVNWLAGQPSNTNAGGNCVEIRASSNGMWSTQACTATNAFICDKPEGKCAPGWIINRGSCYQLNTAIPAAWSEAKHMCDAQGGHLVTIDNRIENDFLVSQFTAMNLAHVTDMWMGISDRNTDGNFLWSDGTQTVGFTNWNIGQPENRLDEADCGALYAAGYLGPKTWRDDGRCGPNYLQDDGVTPGECNPDKLWPCCSKYGWCGNTDSHCNCPECIDFAKAYDLGDWNTRPCINNYPFICEINADQPVVPLSPDVGLGYCDDMWVLHGDYCYFFEGNSPQNFHDASVACRGMGGELTSILTDVEQSFIGGRLRYFNTQPWIGLHDHGKGGNVVWMDGSRLEFTYWARGNPDYTEVEEHCVQIYSDESVLGKWNDRDCNELLGYICKKRKNIDAAAIKDSPSVSVGGVVAIVIVMLLCMVGVSVLVYCWASGRISSASFPKAQNFAGFSNDTYTTKENPVEVNDVEANKGL